MEVSTLLDTLAQWPPGVIYPALFGLAVLENVFPPFPGDTVALFSGYMAGTGRLSLPGAFAATAAGGWAGFALLFALARVLGRAWVNRHIRPRVNPATWRNAEARMRRHGLWVVLLNRFLAGLRSVIALVAGLLDLPAPAVLTLAALSSGVWHALIVGAGYAIGEDWARINQLLTTYNTIMLSALALLSLIGLLFWFRMKRRRSGSGNANGST